MDADDAPEGTATRSATDCLDDSLLNTLVQGGLDDAAKQRAFEHLAACSNCDARLHRIEAASSGASHFATPLPKPSASAESFVKKQRERSYPYLGAAADGHPNDLGTFAGGLYRVLEWIDSGGTSDVFKAYDTKMESLVALKVLREPKDAKSPRKRGKKQSSARSHFEQEARSGFKLRAGNERLVGVIGSDTNHKPPYLVMDYVEGESLSTRIREAGENGLPADEAKQIIWEVAKGLALVHDQGWVHQDIKPQNIKLPAEGPPKIIDVGLAFEAGGSRSVPRGYTPEYASPEQLAGGEIGIPSDVYNLGVTLYELLTGQLPPRCSEHKTSTGCPAGCGSFTAGKEQMSRMPRPIRAICSKCLRAKPSERYASAREVVAAVESIGRFRRIALRVAAVLIPLIAIGGWVYTRYDKHQERQRAEAAEQHAIQLQAEDERTCNELDQVHGELADLILAERRHVPAVGGTFAIQQAETRKRQVVTRLRSLVTTLKARQQDNPKVAGKVRLAEAALAQAESRYSEVLSLLPKEEVEQLAAGATSASEFAYRACLLRGSALLATDQCAEALETFRRSLTLKPSDPAGIASIGFCLVKLGRDGEYESDINPLIALFEAKKGQPSTYATSVRWLAELYSMRAGWHYKGSRHLLALEDADRAIAVEKLLRERRIEPIYSPGLCTIHANRGNVLAELNRDEEALEAERAALEESIVATWSRPVEAYTVLSQTCQVLDQIMTRSFGAVRGRAVAARIYASTLMAITALQGGQVSVADQESEAATALADTHPCREHAGVYCLAFVIRMQVAQYLCANNLGEQAKKLGNPLLAFKLPSVAASAALRYASQVDVSIDSDKYLRLAAYFLLQAKLNEDFKAGQGTIVNKSKIGTSASPLWSLLIIPLS